MAANIYRVLRGNSATGLGNNLLGCVDLLASGYYALEQIRAAMIQQKDGNVGDDTDWVTVAKEFGFVDANGAVSSAVAHAAFNELDSFYGNAGPALTQFCARMKQ